jgi:hypothetical protein
MRCVSLCFSEVNPYAKWAEYQTQSQYGFMPRTPAAQTVKGLFFIVPTHAIHYTLKY